MGSSPPPSPWRRRLLIILRLSLVGVITTVVALTAYLKVVGLPASAASAPSPFRGDLQNIRGLRSGIPVLFVGNSLTYSNSMPHMLQELAAHSPGAIRIAPYQYTPGGGWLGQAAGNLTLRHLLIDTPWTYVVLQEDSHVSDNRGWVDGYTVPAARELLDHVPAYPIVFETWGYRDGNRIAYPRDTYARMQERAQYAAVELMAGLGRYTDLAPVGYAFSQALRALPGVNLWQEDGVHPSLAGSYLAASVFFDMIEMRGGRRPPRSTYDGGLSQGQAGQLLDLAHSAVMPVEARDSHGHLLPGAGSPSPKLPAIRGNPWSGADGNR